MRTLKGVEIKVDDRVVLLDHGRVIGEGTGRSRDEINDGEGAARLPGERKAVLVGTGGSHMSL